jgi:Protein of unknown function (DUF1572)
VTNTAVQTEAPTAQSTDLLLEVRRQFADYADTIRHCLTQLNDNQIWWRPQANMNSIGNLVLHLDGNVRQRILSDIGGEPSDRDRFGEFTERRAIPRDELMRRIDELLRLVDVKLGAMPTDRLSEPVQYVVTAGTMHGSVQGLMLRALSHFAGHTQEILFMARLQLGERYVFKNPAGVPPTMRTASN